MSNQQFAIITPTTAAKTTNAQPTNMYDGLSVSADNLGVDETVNILMVAGQTNVQAFFPDGTDAALTSAIPSCTLPGGPSYVFDKTSTTGLCGVYIDFKLK